MFIDYIITVFFFQCCHCWYSISIFGTKSQTIEDSKVWFQYTPLPEQCRQRIGLRSWLRWSPTSPSPAWWSLWSTVCRSHGLGRLVPLGHSGLEILALAAGGLGGVVDHVAGLAEDRVDEEEQEQGCLQNQVGSHRCVVWNKMWEVTFYML